MDIARDDRGYVLTGDDVVKAGRWSHNRDPFLLESSAPGIFACGDVRLSPVKRVASAVGEGSMAIAFVHKFLQQDRGSIDIRRRRPHHDSNRTVRLWVGIDYSSRRAAAITMCCKLARSLDSGAWPIDFYRLRRDQGRWNDSRSDELPGIMIKRDISARGVVPHMSTRPIDRNCRRLLR